MAIFNSGEICVDIKIGKVLGDLSDRGIAGIEYNISFYFPEYRYNNLKVVDDEPDIFYNAFTDALVKNSYGVHNTNDNQFSFGIYPSLNPDVYAWHTLPTETKVFQGDPENIFKIVFCFNPKNIYPVGNGIALVMTVSRKSIQDFLKYWMGEIKIAPRTSEFKGEYLLRWMPNE